MRELRSQLQRGKQTKCRSAIIKTTTTTTTKTKTPRTPFTPPLENAFTVFFTSSSSSSFFFLHFLGAFLIARRHLNLLLKGAAAEGVG
jgi:hypothetical protein